MNAFAAATDKDWIDFPSGKEAVDEVNFWMPNPWGGELSVGAGPETNS